MPLPGDPDAVLAASEHLRSGAAALQDGREVVAARGHAMSDWRGAAATAALATIDGHVRDLERAVDAATQAVAPLARYADELRAAQQDYARGEQMMLDARAAHAAAGSGAADAADRARDAAEQSTDDAGELMTLAEERAFRANEAAAQALADAASRLPAVSPPAAATPMVGHTGSDVGSFLADLGNSLASVGNAAWHDPGAVGAMALGAGAVVLGTDLSVAPTAPPLRSEPSWVSPPASSRPG